MLEVETGVLNQQCSKGLPFTFTKYLRMDQNHVNLLSSHKLLPLWCIIYTLELPVSLFRIALTWHRRTEPLRVWKWVRSTQSCGLQKELTGNFPKASIFIAYHTYKHIPHIQFCWARGTNTILFSFLNLPHKNNSWKIRGLAGNSLKWGALH